MAMSQILGEFFAVFASPEAQANGVQFDRQMCGLWSEALRELMSEAIVMERRIAQTSEAARRADLIAFARTGAMTVGGNVVDLSAIFHREQACNRPDGAAS